jgi:hypothetical protein
MPGLCDPWPGKIIAVRRKESFSICHFPFSIFLEAGGLQMKNDKWKMINGK